MLSPAGIAAAASAAGFPAGEIPTAVAVALAESGGNPAATNRNSNGTVDFGTWQINSVHADLFGMGDWRDVNVNARMAYRVWKDAGGRWSPWVTFTTGAYKSHLGQAGASNVANVPIPGAWGATLPIAPDGTVTGGPSLPNLPNPLEGITSTIAGALTPITHLFTVLGSPDFWKRTGLVVAGILLCVLAAVVLLKDPIESVAKAIP